jgi:two-component system chemotaxis response regulator CheY
MERMEQEMHRAVREDLHLSLILADLDFFKNINDKYGHNAGDMVLRRFTEEISETLRPYDFVGRYGGEEFLVCLPGVNESQAKLIAERMRQRTERMTVFLPEDAGSVQITASFGVTSRIKGAEETLMSMTQHADDAMYRAKREGRNRVRASLRNERIVPSATPQRALQ